MKNNEMTYYKVVKMKYYGLGDVEAVENTDMPVRGDKWVFESFDASISDNNAI